MNQLVKESNVRVLVCGDRNWAHKGFMRRILGQVLMPGDIVIQGEARGADLMAKGIALSLGFEVLSFPAQWEKHGRAAGPIRNRQMLVEGDARLVLAFHNHIEESRGRRT